MSFFTQLLDSVSSLVGADEAPRPLSWEAGGLDLRVSGMMGMGKRLAWSRLCVSGDLGSGIDQWCDESCSQALALEMGVARVGSAVFGKLALARAASAHGKRFYEIDSLSRSPLVQDPSALLARALDQGGACAMELARGEEGAPPESHLWEALDMLGKACLAAKYPMFVCLTLDPLTDTSVAHCDEFMARFAKAPAGSKLLLSLPLSHLPHPDEWPMGKSEWFDALWLGRLGIVGKGGIPELLNGPLKARLPTRHLEAMVSAGFERALSELGSGEGYWVQGAEGGSASPLRAKGPFHAPRGEIRTQEPAHGASWAALAAGLEAEHMGTIVGVAQSSSPRRL